MSTNSGQKIQRDQKTQLPLLKSWSKSRVLRMPPHSTLPEWAEHWAAPLARTPHTPTLKPSKEQAHPQLNKQVSRQGSLFVLTPLL